MSLRIDVPGSQHMTAAYKAVLSAMTLEAEARATIARAEGARDTAKEALDTAEAAYVRAGATDSGKNVEQRSAILRALTAEQRQSVMIAEQVLADARLQHIGAALALRQSQIRINALQTQLRMVEIYRSMDDVGWLDDMELSLGANVNWLADQPAEAMPVTESATDIP